jgi:hypothetical protein
MSDRGTGRTTKMLKALGEGRSVVIVHNDPMRVHVLQLTRLLNAGDNGARNVVAIRVREPGDTERLNGLSCPIVVDHAFWENARDDTVKAVRIFAERAALASPPKE